MRSNERGIALILVLVILPLVAIIMTQLSFETAIGDRLAGNALANQQFKLAIHARIRQLRLRLVRDLTDDEARAGQEGGKYDHYGDLWGPDHEGGKTAVSVTRGEEDDGDDVTLFTECVDEQGKFNLNLLLMKDEARAQRATETFKRLLDLFRDSRYEDLEDNRWDLNDVEAREIATAVVKFMKGEGQTGPIALPKPDLPDPTPEMKQGLYTVGDLVFAHRLFLEKRLLERFTDVDSGQVIPSLSEFVTVYGSGKVNANTAPIQVLRAMFLEEQGAREVAENILHGRGGFLNTDADQDERRTAYEERQEAEEMGDEDAAEAPAYKTVSELQQNAEGMADAAFLRRNEIDVGRDFSVATNFFTIIVTARRESFMRQHKVVLERHTKGCRVWASEVRTAETIDLPDEGPGAEDQPEQP